MLFGKNITLLLLILGVVCLVVPDGYAQNVGTCTDGNSAQDLDGNNVRARLYNTGALFIKGANPVYQVPKTGNANAIYVSGIWIGGTIDGQLRTATSDYGPYEYWPGPLDSAGNPPADCAAYDRLYKVSRDDVVAYDQTGTPTSDMLDWPFDLGAPVVDGDGNPDNYNLEGGDRPEVIGDQTIWWVMNDVGNVHRTTQTPPIGLEVRVTAFVFDQAGALGTTTFYKYKLLYKGTEPLENAWIGIFSDPDLGKFDDDLVGSDSTLGMGFVYNGNDVDGGATGYGDDPPALGYDFFQGPLVPDPEGGTWVDPDGTEHPGMTRLGMTRFVFYNNDGSVQGNPQTAEDYYNYLRGRWRDGQQITFGGNGRGFSTREAQFMYPADPPGFWSEENVDGLGGRNEPSDRRMVMSTGPFTIQPGDQQEIVFGIVFGQAQNNRFASVQVMKANDIVAQGAFNLGFDVPRPPDPPDVKASVSDQTVTLNWGYEPTANNFLGSYEAPSPFLIDPNVSDNTFKFEGYIVYQFESESDEVGRPIAVYDLKNNVTNIKGDVLDPITSEFVTAVLVPARDMGVKSSHTIGGLTNYTEYHFGVQAFAYNQNSAPPVYRSPIVRQRVIPTPVDMLEGGTRLVAEIEGDVGARRIGGTGSPEGVFGKVVDPSRITGDEYQIEFQNATLDGEEVLTYDLLNATTGETLIDGDAFIDREGKNVPFGQDIVTVDGLSFTLIGEEPGFRDFRVTANAAGPIEPPEFAAVAFRDFPVEHDPGDAQQVGPGHWAIHTADSAHSYTHFPHFISRVTRDGAHFSEIIPYDWEIRFTEAGGYGYDLLTGAVLSVPFELWRIGAGTPDDPTDDVRIVPYLRDVDGDLAFSMSSWGEGETSGGFGDHGLSGGANDPFTDWFYWYLPDDMSAGDAGYNTWEAAALALPVDPGLGVPRDEGFEGSHVSQEVMARMVFGNWNGGEQPPFNQDLPETGSVFQIVSTKPFTSVDVFAIDTQGLQPVRSDQEIAENALDQVGIVPNPYRGASNYERTRVVDRVRFTGLPEECTIRVFTLSGQLVRVFAKNSPESYQEWDLQTQSGLPIASGLYLIHVTVPEVGERVLKFAVVKKKVRLIEL